MTICWRSITTSLQALGYAGGAATTTAPWD